MPMPLRTEFSYFFIQCMEIAIKKCMSAGNFKEMKHDMYKKAKQQDFVAPGGRYSVQLWDVNNDSTFVVQLWFGGLL